MTPPTPAAALEWAVHAVHCGKAHGYESEHSEAGRRFVQMEADDLAVALAASGWQVTREGEGLRAALEYVRDAAAEVMRSYSRGDLDSDYDRWAGTLDSLVDALSGEEQARAALASGEEGQ